MFNQCLQVIALLLVLPVRIQGISSSVISKYEVTKAGCGKTKSCYSDHTSCSSSSDCRFLSTYSTDGDDVIITLSGKADYVAIGFGENNRMPKTDAIACLQSSKGVLIQQYWIKEYDDPSPTSPTPSVIKRLYASYEDGIVKCRFSRPINPVGIPSMLNLSERVYVVFARGPVESEDSEVEVDYHSYTAFTLDKVDIADPTNLNAVYGRNAAMKAHAILMCFAWVVCATIGLFLARYMRGAWPQRAVFGTKIWFQLHRAVMLLTVLLTIVAFITIFVGIGEFTKRATAHAVVGILVLSLAVVQPVMAILRPAQGDSKRPIFNWIHRGVGALAHLLSIVNVFLGVSMSQMGMGSSGIYVMIVYVILIVLVVCFEIFLFLRKKDNYTRFEMEPGEVEVQTTTSSVEDERPRVVMLVVVVITTVVVFGALLGLSVSDED